MKHWSCFMEISKDPEQDNQHFLYFFLRHRSEWLSRESGEARLHTSPALTTRSKVRYLPYVSISSSECQEYRIK